MKTGGFQIGTQMAIMFGAILALCTAAGWCPAYPDTYREPDRALEHTEADGSEGWLPAWLLRIGQDPRADDGRSPSADGNSTTGQPDDLRRRLEKLKAVPYTSVTPEKVDAQASGVVVYEPALVWNGYNLYCCEVCPDVLLMDMAGEIVHRWLRPDSVAGRGNHAIVLPNGDAVALTKSTKSLVRLDWQSNLVWKKTLECHHDVMLSPDSTLYVVVDETRPHRDLVVKFPSVLELALDGTEISRWSAYEHLDEIRRTFDQTSFLDALIDSMLAEKTWDETVETISRRVEAQPSEGEVVYDYFHMNTIGFLPETPLGETDGRFKAGNLLVCFRHVNQIAVLDKVTKKVLWAWGEGRLEWPHQPTMLENGNILIFDNGIMRRFSRVIELDPITETIEWEYVGDPPRRFYSHARGSAQRLPNGNTLICEGDKGRSFEVTREGDIVWEWLNPVIEQGCRAQVYRMMRLSPESVKHLLVAE